MKKFLRVMYNFGFVVLYMIGLLFVEAFCAVKWTDLAPGDWTIWTDLLLVLSVIALLMIHYLLMGYLVKSGNAAKVSLYIVTIFEALFTLGNAGFLLMLSIYYITVSYVKSWHAYVFALVIQLVILSARGISWYFLIKKRRDKSTN